MDVHSRTTCEADSVMRFSKTVENYILFRPGYPLSLLDFMKQELGLQADSCIADVGSGTGKLTELFLKNGNPIYAIEPNAEMSKAAKLLLGHFTNFHSVRGTAEKTGLPEMSMDFIVAAQAFHWFDLNTTRAEFIRIGKPEAWTLLIWNDRLDDKSNFMAQYNDFLHQFSTDLKTIDHRNIGQEQFNEFFGRANYAEWHADFSTSFDFEGLKGRYLSCSYAFDLTHPLHGNALHELKTIFARNENRGKVEMWYRTKVYYGRLNELV